MLQGVLHQFLGGHIDHVVVTGDDIVHLRLHALGDELRWVVPVEPVHLAVDQALQVLHGVLDGRGKEVVGHRANGIAHVGDEIGVVHHHGLSRLRAQVGEFLEHFVGGTEVEGQRSVAVLKALGGKQQAAIDLILGVLEVDVAGGHHGLLKLRAQPHHRAVKLPELLLALGKPLGEHKGVVAQGLDLQKVVERGDAQ